MIHGITSLSLSWNHFMNHRYPARRARSQGTQAIPAKKLHMPVATSPLIPAFLLAPLLLRMCVLDRNLTTNKHLGNPFAFTTIKKLSPNIPNRGDTRKEEKKETTNTSLPALYNLPRSLSRTARLRVQRTCQLKDTAAAIRIPPPPPPPPMDLIVFLRGQLGLRRPRERHRKNLKPTGRRQRNCN